MNIFFVNVHLKLLSPEAFFSPKCTKYRLAAGLRPDPLGELTALPQTPLAGLRGLLLKEGKRRGGDRRGQKRGGEGKGKGAEGGEGKGSINCMTRFHAILVGCLYRTRMRAYENLVRVVACCDRIALESYSNRNWNTALTKSSAVAETQRDALCH